MKKLGSRKGSVLAFSLIILSVLLISALTIAGVTAVEQQSALSTQKSVLAFQAADSGAERVIKRIYIDNSPSLTVPLNADMGTAVPPGDSTISNLAGKLTNVTGASCDSATNAIIATNNQDPVYTFQISFFKETTPGVFTPIPCNSNQWRDGVLKIQSIGFFRGTSRVIEIGIRPRE